MIVLFLAAGLARSQELTDPDEASKVMAAVRASVVAVRNPEGYGSGVLLNAEGLVLTNAHVVVSPLPFHVEVEALTDQGWRSVYFRRVTLLGVHPKKDLALLRFDPSEHPLALNPMRRAEEAPLPGERVYVVGYPASHGGHRKVLVEGRLRQRDRFVDMPGYLDLEAGIFPGNSGGPVCDARGRAVGLVTWGEWGRGEAGGMAIPLHDVQPDAFVPLARREGNPARAAKSLALAERLLKDAQERRSAAAARLAETFFSKALAEDFPNADTHYKLGLIYRRTGRFAPAAAYLVRALQIRPWPESGGKCYHELGVALAYLGRGEQALAAWREGLAKYPLESDLWDAMAAYHWNLGRTLEAAAFSRAAIRTFAGRAQKMNELYQRAREKLSPEELIRLRDREGALEAELESLRARAEDARREGRAFLTAEGERLIRDYDGIQRQIMESSPPPAAPAAPSAGDPRARAAQYFLKAAKAFLLEGKTGQALEIFEELVRDYPERPEAREAQGYLDALRKP
ncbi:MAG TPA: tetratricopeptide repeat-containing serine protease family protein [Planctomycetota bacterium]|nr:tetratricopeptide repeat-containing serine protease family protein [Planctomycetota bacterium]